MTQDSSSIRPDQMAPHSVEAEEAVLGSILINPDALFDVAAFLQPDDFFIVRNGWVYEAILRLQERNEQIDYVTVVEELRQQGRLEEVDGAAYITYLINHTPSSIYTETYGRIVERAALRRRMLDAASTIARMAHEESADINDVIDRSEAALFAVTERRLRKELVPIRTAIMDYFDRIEYLYSHQEESLGVPSGFTDLDRLLGGFQKSDLIIVAGRPGMGKTSWLLTAALNAARTVRARIAIFSMEMSNEQIVSRLVSAETGIGTHELRLGKLDDRQWALFVEATGKLSHLRINLDDTPALSPIQMRAKCRRLYSEHGLDLIMVDYLQLMSSGLNRNENRVQEISFISRHLKQIARELNVPVLAAAQLSRAVEQRQDKRPQLSDLRESGCLTGDTLVTLADSGARVPMRETAGKAGFSVWALNEMTMKLERAEVSRAFNTGLKPVFRLTTKLGRTIRATGNHQFRTFDGWRRLDELTANDRIALPRMLASPPTQTMTDAELALLGHLIGDGCTLPRHVIQYTTCEQDIAETVARLADEVFGEMIRPRVEREKGHRWYQVFLSAEAHLTHGVRNPVAEWLRALGVFGLRSYEKRVPEKVFCQPSRSIALFLRHLWATDGCIKLTPGGARSIPRIYYASSSPQLASDVQSLLLRLGINARLKRISQNGCGRDQYHVILSGKEDIERFVDQVGATGVRKQRDLAAVADYTRTRSANTNRDVLPETIWRDHAIPAMRSIQMTGRELQAQLGNAYCGTALYRQNVSRERAARLADVVRSPELSALADSDVYWDRIASVEPDGEEEVFDLTVPGHHNFVAGDIIVHNSIEQDADVVIFIYRDEVYNENTERPNQADVIVAKHRNGPTGQVALFFKKELTQFANIAKTDVNLTAY